VVATASNSPTAARRTTTGRNSPTPSSSSLRPAEIVFIDQYRPTIRQTQTELPAGIVEDGESYTVAGARELREETGFDPDGVSLLQEVWCSTGVLRHQRGYVFAEGLTPCERELDSNEFIEVQSVPIEDAIGTARQRPTNDATLEGLLLAKEDGLL